MKTMTNLWNQLFSTQLFNSLGSSKKARQRLGSHQKRTLQLESLERRQLMAFNVSGTVFTDLTDNGTVEVGDPRLSGVTINLYTAGPNNIFDDGTGDDVQVATTTSAATTGFYNIPVTVAGNYLVKQQTPVTGQVQRASARSQLVTVSAAQIAGTATPQVASIDTFNSPTTTIQAVFNGLNPDSDSTATVEAVGGVRDIFANAIAGTLDLTVDSGNNNALNASPQPGGDGVFLITYDGDGANGRNLLGTQLGAGTNDFDLTAAGAASAFRLLIGAPPGVTTSTLTVRVAGVGGTSTVTRAIPASPTGVADQTMVIDFSELVGSANLSQVGAIQFEINQDNSEDTQIDSIVTFLNQTVINFANLNPMTIGNQVFLDRINNGTFDTGGANPDIGIGDVNLQLFNDVNNNQLFDAGTDTAVTIGDGTATSSTTANTLGQYQFTGLLPGNYIVLIPATEFTAGQPLFNLVSSTGVGTVDVNGTDKGAPVSNTAGAAVFAAVALTSGGEPTTDGDTDGNTNLTVDFGFAPPALTLVKDDNPNLARVGDILTYTLTVTNTSPIASGRDSTGTVITDTLPTGLTLDGANPTPFTITNPNGTASNATFNSTTRVITANVGTLVPGQVATLTITALVGATFVNNTTNTGTVANVEGSGATGNVVTPLAPNVDLEVVKTIQSGTTTVGNTQVIAVSGTLIYRITVNNLSATAVTGVTINDDLPVGFTPGVLPVGVTAGIAPADLVWAVGNLAANGTATIDIPVVAPATPGTALANTASLVTAGQSFTDTTVGNNQSIVLVNVLPSVDLLITKDDSLTTINTGATLTYALTVNNSGPSAAVGVGITDTLPAQLEFVSANIGNVAFGNPIAGQVFTGPLPSIASGTSVTVYILARVRANAVAGAINNTASLVVPNTLIETGVRANIASDVNTVVNRVVTLGVQKDDSVNIVTAGGANFTYTITAFNQGSADTTNAIVRDTLPTGINFVSGTFTLNGGAAQNVLFDTTTREVTANIGTLTAGGSLVSANRGIITLTVNAAATAAAGQITNTARVTSQDVTVPVQEDEVTTIERSFNVTVDKSVNRTTATSGDTLLYTIVVTNTGFSAATNVLVTDVLPTNVTFVSASSGFTNTNGTVSGTIASLLTGSPTTITISATVNNNAPNGAVINNPVTVVAPGEPAGNTGDNADSANTTVANVASISGTVYIDTNNNGIQDIGEAGIPNITVRLTGTATVGGATVNTTTTTGVNGGYTFANLQLGTYTVTQEPSANFIRNTSDPGEIGIIQTGTPGVGTITGIALTGISVNNRLPNSQIISKRLLLASENGVAVGNNSSRPTNAFRRR